MKIGVISSQVFPSPPAGYAGLELVAWQCAEGLAKLGEDITLFAPEGSTTQQAKLITTGPAGSWDEKKAYSSYWQHLLGFDVLIDHGWQKYSYLLKMEGVLKAPILGVLHAPVNTMYQTLPPVDNPCMVCISKDQADHFQAFHGREARFVRNGVDGSFYKAIPGVKRTNRYLFLARFSSIKGADLGLMACKETGAGLDLVGDISITNEPEYFNNCKQMCDGTQLKMVGPATRGECVYHFSQAYALLHPNKRFREPLGLAPIEAQLCGTPVVAYDFGAMRETVKPGLSGYLVRSHNEMVDIIRNRLVDNINRQACREWALQFSLENMAKGYRELCYEALEKGW